jgi:tight adherence protein B
MGWLPLLSSLFTGLAVILFGRHSKAALLELHEGEILTTVLKPKQSSGILSVIDSLRAHVKAGGSLEEALADQMDGEPISLTPCMPNREQLQDMMHTCLDAKETREQADQAAVELDLACRLIGALGCEATHCLDAVASSYRRNRMLKTLKDSAFTVPKSTVKLLSLLPLATLVLGELMGASPIAFLIGKTAGHVCLALGTGSYMLGMLWMRTLMDGVAAAGQGYGDAEESG